MYIYIDIYIDIDIYIYTYIYIYVYILAEMENNIIGHLSNAVLRSSVLNCDKL